MIVGKEFKSMYKFLTKVYEILNKGGNNAILYTNSENELMYQAFCISGKIKITRDQENMLNDDLKKYRFYELSKLPRERFKLKEIELENDEMKEEKQTLLNRFEITYDFVCELKGDEERQISKLTRLCERYINDSYSKMIKNFGACEVSATGQYIMFEKNEYFKDEMMNAEESMCLFCETYRSVDENIQGKLKFEEQERCTR